MSLKYHVICFNRVTPSMKIIGKLRCPSIRNFPCTVTHHQQLIIPHISMRLKILLVIRFVKNNQLINILFLTIVARLRLPIVSKRVTIYALYLIVSYFVSMYINFYLSTWEWLTKIVLSWFLGSTFFGGNITEKKYSVVFLSYQWILCFYDAYVM